MMYPKATHRSRQGHAAVEMILLFPLVASLLLGMIEFSLLLSARQQLLSASRLGATIAARGGDENEVQEAITEALERSVDVAVDRLPGEAPHSRDSVRVVVNVPARDMVPNLLPFILDLSEQNLSAATVMAVEWSEPANVPIGR